MINSADVLTEAHAVKHPDEDSLPKDHTHEAIAGRLARTARHSYLGDVMLGMDEK